MNKLILTMAALMLGAGTALADPVEGVWQTQVDDGAYAGAASSGTFTHGHVGPDALEEVLRVVRPGGVVALSINAEHWEAKGYDARLAELGPRIADLAVREVRIYGPEASGPHARDLSRVVTFTRA